MPSSSRNPYSRFVPSEEVGEVTQWQFGDVDGPNPFHALPVDEEDAPNLIDEEQQQALVQKTWDEAFALGVAQGQEEATVQWQQRMDDYVALQGQQATQHLAQIVHNLNTRLDGMQQQMSEQILHLACDVARHVVRQELTGQPLKLQLVVHEALGLLIQEGRPATVRLHPDDIQALSLAFGQPSSASVNPPVQWVADSMIEPGGCLVECAGTVIDATIPKRWERAIAALGLNQPWQQERPLADNEVSASVQTESAGMKAVEPEPVEPANTSSVPTHAQAVTADTEVEVPAAHDITEDLHATNLPNASGDINAAALLVDQHLAPVDQEEVKKADPDVNAELSDLEHAIGPLYMGEKDGK